LNPETTESFRHDLATVFLQYENDQQDRLLFPTEGGALRVEAERSIGGEELWRAEATLNWAIALDGSRRGVVTPRFGIGVSGGAEDPSWWFDPGGYRDLYGAIPYSAAAPQYVRAGVTVRQRLFSRGLFDFHLEVGVDAIQKALTRGELDEVDELFGYGASLTAHADLIGPITVGWARNDEGNSTFFILAGYAFGP
jgi:hypothetical protein